MKQDKKKLPNLDVNHYLIDSHCHLDMESYSKDIQQVLARAFDNGIKSVITIGIDYSSSLQAIAIASKYPMVKATAGVHPHDVGSLDIDGLDKISALIDRHRDKIVGYGEIGLDYVKKYSPQDIQLQSFQDQLALAKNFNLPVIIHDREAHQDILKILRQFAPFPRGGVMHCFSGDLNYARKVLDLGFSISIPGIVTFKNARALREVAQSIPAESMLVETDGPFLAPVPYRGKRNEPLYLLHTAQEIAQLRQVSLENIAKITTRNTENLFAFTCGD